MAVIKHAKTRLAHKKLARQRRAQRARAQIRALHLRNSELVRLCITRSSKHITAQLIKVDPLNKTSAILAAVSTMQEAIKGQCDYTGNVKSAAVVGKAIAEIAKEKGLHTIAFDRSGYKYHGRVKALADAARENGLEF